MKIISVILIMLLISACTTTSKSIQFNLDTFKITAKDQNSYGKSIEAIMKKLPEDKQKEFQIAIIKIQAFDYQSIKNFMESKNNNSLYKKIDGLTYSELMELSSKHKSKISVFDTK